MRTLAGSGGVKGGGKVGGGGKCKGGGKGKGKGKGKGLEGFRGGLTVHTVVEQLV